MGDRLRRGHNEAELGISYGLPGGGDRVVRHRDWVEPMSPAEEAVVWELEGYLQAILNQRVVPGPYAVTLKGYLDQLAALRKAAP